jgi:hypothetical protein
MQIKKNFSFRVTDLFRSELRKAAIAEGQTKTAFITGAVWDKIIMINRLNKKYGLCRYRFGDGQCGHNNNMSGDCNPDKCPINEH